jgi:kinesin family member 18/19
MVGTSKDPGLMVLSLKTIFDLIKKDESSDAFDVSCSYLEVYNEVDFEISPYKALKVHLTCMF